MSSQWICHYSFTPATVLLDILYLINTHISDGQHKELYRHQQCQKQWGEQQPRRQPTATPPLTLEQVLAMQEQMLQTMQQTMVNLHAQPQATPPLRDRLGDFQRTKLSIFFHAMESMDVDDWLKSVAKKLQVVQCNNCEKVLLASHQLF
jgi:hypothetical protein